MSFNDRIVALIEEANDFISKESLIDLGDFINLAS